VSRKLLELETSNLVGDFVWECRAGAQINFPECGRGLGHVTPTIFGSTVGYPSDSLASCSLSSPTAKTTGHILSVNTPNDAFSAKDVRFAGERI